MEQLLLASLFLLAVFHPTSSLGNWRLYDTSAYTECKRAPKPPLYYGGVIINPEFDTGLAGWSPFGSCVLELRSERQNVFVVATNRTATFNGPSQTLQNLYSGVKYSLSAWVQIKGPATSAFVKATLVVNGNSYICAGAVIAKSGCWSFLKGGFSLDITPTSARLYFETANIAVDIWLDSVSLQPFTAEDWRLQQKTWIEKYRKRKVRINIYDNNTPLKGAEVEILQTKMGFPFGSAIANTILNNSAYQKWFVKRFNVASFENELKWYATEPQSGKINYNTSDRMLAFCKSNNISVRGHNIFWDDARYTPQWVTNLSKTELQKAVQYRMNSLVVRYAGDFIHWDVVNEMLHFSFFEDKLGLEASTSFYLTVQQLDPETTLFVNDYNIVESCNDPLTAVDVYIERLKQLKAAGVMKLGIGLEGHFFKPINVPYMRAVLDILSTLHLPIWLTEVDVNNNALQNITQAAIYLEEVLREGFSHPAVSGIVLWTALHPNGCYRMCLTDNNLKNLPTGDVVDTLLREWRNVDTGIVGKTNMDGHIHMTALMGTYQVYVNCNNRSISKEISIVPGKGTEDVIINL